MATTIGALPQGTYLRQLIQERYEQLKNRERHPDGRFDKAGRWYPSEDEARSCCRHIRQPSRSYPYSLMTHCRSREHVARTFLEGPTGINLELD